MKTQNYILAQASSSDVGLEYTNLALENAPGVLLGIAITIIGGFYAVKSFGINKVIERYTTVSEEMLKGYMTLNANLEKLNENINHQGVLLSNQISDISDSVNTHTDAEPTRQQEILKLGFTNQRILDKLENIQRELTKVKREVVDD